MRHVNCSVYGYAQKLTRTVAIVYRAGPDRKLKKKEQEQESCAIAKMTEQCALYMVS